MAYKLKPEIGKAIYAARKCTVEPVIGIIKEVLGFRQFSLRGGEAAAGEWCLVCLAFNLKRLHSLLLIHPIQRALYRCAHQAPGRVEVADGARVREHGSVHDQPVAFRTRPGSTPAPTQGCHNINKAGCRPAQATSGRSLRQAAGDTLTSSSTPRAEKRFTSGW